jgi:hypothetical protein
MGVLQFLYVSACAPVHDPASLELDLVCRHVPARHAPVRASGASFFYRASWAVRASWDVLFEPMGNAVMTKTD